MLFTRPHRNSNGQLAAYLENGASFLSSKFRESLVFQMHTI